MTIPDDVSLMMNATGLLAQIMPALAGLLVAGSFLKLVGKIVPMAETPRNTLMRVGGFAVSFSVFSIGAMIALTLVLVNMSALKAQQHIQSFLQDVNHDVEHPSRSR